MTSNAPTALQTDLAAATAHITQVQRLTRTDCTDTDEQLKHRSARPRRIPCIGTTSTTRELSVGPSSESSLSRRGTRGIDSRSPECSWEAKGIATGFRLRFCRNSRPADAVPRYRVHCGEPGGASAGRPHQARCGRHSGARTRAQARACRPAFRAKEVFRRRARDARGEMRAGVVSNQCAARRLCEPAWYFSRRCRLYQSALNRRFRGWPRSPFPPCSEKFATALAEVRSTVS